MSPTSTDTSEWIVACGRHVLRGENGSLRLDRGTVRRVASPWASSITVSDSASGALFATWAPVDRTLPHGVEAVNLRSLFTDVFEAEFRLAGKAFQLAHWDRTHLFCGLCGGETRLDSSDLMRACVSCGNTVYPRISPATITAVVRDGRLLLAHNAQRSHPFYSVLAGFVDPGETLEECVVREVYEETGIVCGSVRYMSSQPWPFPDSLMIAFTAEYVSGEIAVDRHEIDHAYWCGPHELPRVPPPPSVARKLIDWFVATYG